MKHVSRAAMLAAGTALCVPAAVCATPRADGSDPKALVAQINQAFEEFKATNDAALKNKADDTVVSEKLANINAAITEMTTALEKAQADLAAAQLGGAGGDTVSPEAKAHAAAFNTFFRKGTEPANMRELEVQAKLTTQSDADGGYLVPEEMEGTIDRVLGTQSAIRAISRVINISGQTY